MESYAELEMRARRIARDSGRIWAVLTPEDRIRYTDLARRAGHIIFPAWVTTTPCETRTFSVVIPGFGELPPIGNSLSHGAIRIEQTFPNYETETRRRKGRPGFYTAWKHDPRS